jgi:hypothetical protein
MKKFNPYDFKKLKHNQVLKIKIKTNDEWLYIKYASELVLQSYQPAHTPINKYHFEVIKDIDLYFRDIEDEDNYLFLAVERENLIMWVVEEQHHTIVEVPTNRLYI